MQGLASGIEEYLSKHGVMTSVPPECKGSDFSKSRICEVLTFMQGVLQGVIRDRPGLLVLPYSCIQHHVAAARASSEPVASFVIGRSCFMCCKLRERLCKGLNTPPPPQDKFAQNRGDGVGPATVGGYGAEGRRPGLVNHRAVHQP